LTTFGAPEVRVDGHEPPSDVPWRKHIALLCYLALSPNRTRTRAQLIGVLWPETTDQRARHSLNEAVRRLRAGLGADRLKSTGSGENLTLADERLTVDALEFERLADSDGPRLRPGCRHGASTSEDEVSPS
jgi:DNA-binding SARP family transcriptional activator